MSILIGIATFILILISLFLILVVLAQKAKSDGGMGAAMGGGMAEAAFGAETGNVLTTATINAAVAFFILTFLVYLGQVYQHKHSAAGTGALPNIPVSSLPLAPLTPRATPAVPGASTTPASTPTPTPSAATTPGATGSPAAAQPVPAPTPAPEASAPAATPSAAPVEAGKK